MSKVFEKGLTTHAGYGERRKNWCLGSGDEGWRGKWEKAIP